MIWQIFLTNSVMLISFNGNNISSKSTVVNFGNWLYLIFSEVEQSELTLTPM
jgi:hypothetical protein